jgi:hypothetical protein
MDAGAGLPDSGTGLILGAALDGPPRSKARALAMNE